MVSHRKHHAWLWYAGTTPHHFSPVRNADKLLDRLHAVSNPTVAAATITVREAHPLAWVEDELGLLAYAVLVEGR